MNFFSRARFPVTSRQVPSPPKECEGQLYTVRRFDTLYRIARKFGVTVQQILAVNPQITNPDSLFVGQKICIPESAPPPQPNGRSGTPWGSLQKKGSASHKKRAVGLRPYNCRATLRPVSRSPSFLEATGTKPVNWRGLALAAPVPLPGLQKCSEVPGNWGVYIVACISNVCTSPGKFSLYG